MVSQVRDLLTPSAVAGVLGMMARTAVGLGGEARQLVRHVHLPASGWLLVMRCDGGFWGR